MVALSHGQGAVGAGVVVGSNVFNLAALLGLGALVAGRFGLHRKVVLLSGTVAVWVALVCMLTVLGTLTPVAALVLVSARARPVPADPRDAPGPPRRTARTRRLVAMADHRRTRGGSRDRGGGQRPSRYVARRRGRRADADRGGGREHADGDRRHHARHPVPRGRHHHRRARARGGHLPAQRGGRGLPRGPRTRRRGALDRAEQQRAEHRGRAAAARRDHRAWVRAPGSRSWSPAGTPG